MARKLVVSIVAIFFTIFFASRVDAQDVDQECDISAIKATYEEQLASADTLEDLENFQSTLASTLAKCRQRQPAEPLPTVDFGPAVQGVLSPGVVSEYTFEADAGAVVTITAVKISGDADLALELYRPNGQLLFTDDDSGEGLNPRIADLVLPDSGQYRIVATQIYGNKSATFELAVVPGTIPRNFTATGSSVDVDSLVSGVVFVGEVTEYTFEAEAQDVITITATKSSGYGTLTVELYRPNGQLFFADSRSGESNNPQIANLPLPDSGQYRIVVTRSDLEDESATFELAVVPGTIPRNFTATGSSVDVDSLVSGVVFVGEVTEYTFEAEAQDVVTITAVKISGDADLALELYRPNGQLLFTDDDSGEGLNPRIADLVLPDSGQYRIVVKRAYDNDSSALIEVVVGLSG